VFAEAASTSCATTAVTVSVPRGWRGAVEITTESGDVAFNSALNFTSLRLETWLGHIASIWEAPLVIDGGLVVVAHDQGSTVYLARAALTGSGGARCRFETEGNGEITTSFVDMPDKQTACAIDIDAGTAGYVGLPNLRGIDGRFDTQVSGVTGEVSITGVIVHYDAGSKGGTIGTGIGLHSLSARTSGGRAIIFCRVAASTD
jgi:hypothetical protein